MENNNEYYHDKTKESQGGYNYGEPERIDFDGLMKSGRKSRSWAVASMACAIASIICCCIPVAGLVFGGFSILFAIISRMNLGYFDNLALIGLIVAIFGVVFCVFSIAFTYSDYYKQFTEEFYKTYEEEYGNMDMGSSF